jgi:5-methyltetrahydrofolate--homocysteine methyltransferase
MNAFVKALQDGPALLMDGAMGTELQRLTASKSIACADRFNLDQPELVRSIHQAYVQAGADVILTNTFQANPAALTRHRLNTRQHDIWQTAIGLARSARPRFVLADIGHVENCSWEVAADLMAESTETDGILLETWTSIDDFRRFADQRRADGLPLLVSFTFHRTSDLMTFLGASPEDCAKAAAEYGALAIGANCGKNIGMEDMLEIVTRYQATCDLPVFVRPNAGSPSKSGLHYPRTPDTMASALVPLLDAGIAMIGGCCGTTPEHIRRFRDVMASRAP